MKLNDFKTDLEYSLEARELEMFDNFYMRIFGADLKIELVTDKILQFKGIDKILHLPSGKKLYIDEKKRRGVWNDILVEIWSNTEKKTPGWVFKPFPDYIVYAFLKTHKCYLLPALLLRLWVSKNWNNVKKFKEIKAQNLGYTTTSYAIPIPILLNGLRDEMERII